MSNVRGFNFIADYGKGLDVNHVGNLDHHLEIISKFKNACERYKDKFNNMELEMKRFISWFHWTYNTEDYRYMIEHDSSGFLKDCISLYDPEKNNIPAPTNAYDYSSKF